MNRLYNPTTRALCLSFDTCKDWLGDGTKRRSSTFVCGPLRSSQGVYVGIDPAGNGIDDGRSSPPCFLPFFLPIDASVEETNERIVDGWWYQVRPQPGARNESGDNARTGAAGSQEDANREHETCEERPAMCKDRQSNLEETVRSSRHRKPMLRNAKREERTRETRGNIWRVGKKHRKRCVRGGCTGEG